MNMVNQLIMMGVPELAAKHAVFKEGANGAEACAEWFFMNIENPAI